MRNQENEYLSDRKREKNVLAPIKVIEFRQMENTILPDLKWTVNNYT